MRHGFLRNLGTLPVNARHHDQLGQLLHGPAIVHELRGQPVQQFGMRRHAAAMAEIAGRRHQALPEVILPDAVDHHARGQRIVFAGDPVRQALCDCPWRWRRRAAQGREPPPSAERNPGGTASGGLPVVSRQPGARRGFPAHIVDARRETARACSCGTSAPAAVR